MRSRRWGARRRARKLLFQSRSKTWPGDKWVYLNRIPPRGARIELMGLWMRTGIPKKTWKQFLSFLKMIEHWSGNKLLYSIWPAVVWCYCWDPCWLHDSPKEERLLLTTPPPPPPPPLVVSPSVCLFICLSCVSDCLSSFLSTWVHVLCIVCIMYCMYYVLYVLCIVCILLGSSAATWQQKNTT